MLADEKVTPGFRFYKIKSGAVVVKQREKSECRWDVSFSHDGRFVAAAILKTTY